MGGARRHRLRRAAAPVSGQARALSGRGARGVHESHAARLLRRAARGNVSRRWWVGAVLVFAGRCDLVDRVRPAARLPGLGAHALALRLDRPRAHQCGLAHHHGGRHRRARAGHRPRPCGSVALHLRHLGHGGADPDGAAFLPRDHRRAASRAAAAELVHPARAALARLCQWAGALSRLGFSGTALSVQPCARGGAAHRLA